MPIANICLYLQRNYAVGSQGPISCTWDSEGFRFSARIIRKWVHTLVLMLSLSECKWCKVVSSSLLDKKVGLPSNNRLRKTLLPKHFTYHCILWYSDMNYFFQFLRDLPHFSFRKLSSKILICFIQVASFAFHSTWGLTSFPHFWVQPISRIRKRDLILE